MIKLGDEITLPCGAKLEITQLVNREKLQSKGGLVGVTIRVDQPYSGAIVNGEFESDLGDVTLNFFGQNIRTLIETLEKLEEAVCPRK